MTLISRGETVGALLKDVSLQTGVTLEAMPQTKGDVVIVSVKHVPLDSFERRLASAIGAQWKNEGGTLRLVLPRSLEKSQEEAERRLRIQEVTAGITELRKKIAAQPPFDSKAAHQLASDASALLTKFKGHIGDSPGLEALMAMEAFSPGGRLAIAAVSTLTPEQIADVQPGGRIVYSTDPTPMQRPDPEGVYPAVKRYLEEQQIFAEELKKQPGSSKWNYRSIPLLNLETPEPPAGVMFSTERSPYNNSLTIRMQLVKKDGTFASEINTLLDIPSPPSKEPELGQGTIEVSAQSARLLASAKDLQSGKSLFVDRVILSELSQPEKIDPVSYTVADGVLALAQANNLIACIPDSGFFETLFDVETPDGKIDLKRFSHWLTEACEVQTKDGWFTTTPRKLVQTRTNRVDRDLVGAFFRSAQQNNGVTIDEMAEFADHLPLNYNDTIVPFLAFFDFPELNAGINDKNIELLRVYGRLTPDQRSELQSERPITVDSMVDESISDLTYLVYRADSPIHVILRMTGPTPTRSIAEEITVALPKGIPQRAKLALAGNSFDAVLMDGGTSTFAPYEPMTASSLGYELARAASADATDKREQVKVEKYRFGHTRVLNFELALTDTVTAEATFHESKFSRNDASVPFDQLPAAFRQAVEDAETKARNRLAQTADKRQVPPP